MRNIKLTIEYDGTDFYGWQYQPDKLTVQGEIEKAIKKITNEDIRIIGAGRTDQGVHAFAQVANFKTELKISPEKLKKALNSLTGDNIYIKEVVDVSLDFHARFSAKSKIYQYKIMRQPSPLNRRYYWFVEYKLNLEMIQKVILYFTGEHDFKNLSVADETHGEIQKSTPNCTESTVCVVYDLSLTYNDSRIIITIEANRFLHKMVRGIVGTLVDIGRGRFKSDDINNIFAGKIKNLYFAPPQGLCLMEVRY